MLEPKTLLQIDAVGAGISALSLGAILPQFPEFLGFPERALYLLAAFPVVFVALDLVFLFNTTIRYSTALYIMAALNLFYCGLSVVLLEYHIGVLRMPAVLYIVGEVLIVAVLAIAELRTAQWLRFLDKQNLAGD